MIYKKHLDKDKKLRALLLENDFELELKKNIPLRLMRSIMGQQLSTKVAQVIYDRFLALYNNKEPKPQQVIDTPNEVLRAIGLSNAKVQYLKNVAAFCIEHKINDKKLATLSNENITELLVAIKGVGKWTVEMLLMFALGREDVFSVDDLGIQQAMTKLYSLDASDKKEMKQQMIEISTKWQPYRTYACLHLWSWKDNKPQ
ncbi:MAG: DNA-3-methyladenine glycosylase 2 family protein [Bacteroidetes bacterium]|nr:DNA-3-methyladenine glycosylase 2 family protein [Bacteroidota bacterium]